MCTDETCAPGETCQTRLLFESDYTESADLCMCASGPCAQKTGDVSGAEGGLDAWRVEAPMPSDAQIRFEHETGGKELSGNYLIDCNGAWLCPYVEDGATIVRAAIGARA